MSESSIRIYLMTLCLMLTATPPAQTTELPCPLQSTNAECQPLFHNIARDVSGKMRYMNQSEAIKYCTQQGGHLPSVRELAQLAMSLGAKGIVDSCESDKKCNFFETTNIDGRSDNFSFSYAGYQTPSDDFGTHWFWSSSVFSKNSNFAFGLGGLHGFIGGGSRDVDGAVLCILVPGSKRGQTEP